MHVLMTGDAVGGVWHYVIDLAKSLCARGVTVTVAVLGPPPSPDQVRGVEGFRVVTMDLPLDWTATSRSEVLKAGASLARLATSIGADIVHLHSPALAAGGHYKMPVVAVCHSCVATWWHACGKGPLPVDLAWRRDLAAQGAGRADALLAPTAAFAAETARVYDLPEAPLVIHNGRRARASASSSVAIGPDVFAAGRLWDRAKGMDALDGVAARLSLPVFVAGSTQSPQGKHVVFQHLRLLGHLDEDAIVARLKSRPIFVSLARYEPFGLAVLEAAQAGCALVLADIPTFRELWNDVALFVDPGDSFAVAQVIETLVHHAEGRERFGARARARSTRYSVEAVTDGVLAVFHDLLAPAKQTHRTAALGGVA